MNHHFGIIPGPQGDICAMAHAIRTRRTAETPAELAQWLYRCEVRKGVSAVSVLWAIGAAGCGIAALVLALGGCLS